MSHSSTVFSRVPIELPNRSGFDMSHENVGTMTCGTLTPVLVDELLPNDTVSLGSAFQVQLPPMASDFYGRVDFVLEAFFVPSRLLWGGWSSFMTHPTNNPIYPVNTPVEGKSRYMPQLAFNNQFSSLGPGTLSDYLGFKASTDFSDLSRNSVARVNLLPYLAYHRIWDDWYRDSRIQAPLFYRPNRDYTTEEAVRTGVSFKPYVSGGVDSADVTVSGSSEATFVDGVDIAELRQRNWSKDYFTSASTLPQAGNASTVEFDVDTNGQGVFSIAALRAANSLQKWMERNGLAGYRYSDQIYAQYGIYPSDAIMDRCIYLGRKTQNVYTRSVFQTAIQRDAGSPNPFKSVGNKFGSSQAVGEGSLIDEIRVTEHGYLMVLASLVPHAYYSSGVRRYLQRKVVGDIAFPLLSGVGEQAIMKSELSAEYYPMTSVEGGSMGDEIVNSDEEFAYTDRYAEYKYHDDEVHGLLRDGESLSAFALQRSFGDDVALGSDFLQIPKEYLDQVMAFTTPVVGFTCWYDIYFPYRKVSTLPEYSVPTLADMKHVHTEYISRGGKRL